MRDSTHDRLPAISVLLPVYNAERYIGEALESILAQTYRNFELLVLDDGSTDKSLAIIRKYASKDGRVYLHARPHRGLVPGLNELIATARGQYLARMDADDISTPERFQQEAAFLDAYSDHVAVGGCAELINAAGLPIGIIRPPRSHEDIDRANLKGYSSIWNATAMIRKSAALSIGGYREDFMYAEDLDFWLRIAEVGKLSNLPEVVLRYRLHSASISEEAGLEQQVVARRACVDAWRRRGINEQFEATEPWRPAKDMASRHKFALEYGWSAWRYGHSRTWRAYAWEALRLRPFSISSWRLLIFGFLKRPS